MNGQRAEPRSSFIGGAYAESDSPGDELIERLNPADERHSVSTYVPATERVVKDAIQSANDASAEWRSMTAAARAKVLHGTADRLKNAIDAVSNAVTLESGKTLSDARGEVIRSIEVLHFFAEQAQSHYGDSISIGSGGYAFVDRRALGVVGLIAPWNFPLSIPIWKAAPALAVGNTVVIKPSTLTPAPALYFAEMIQDAGAPAGTVNVVIARGETGLELANNALVAAVSFTGSTQVGKMLEGNVTSRGGRFQGEFGGHSPLVVLKDAPIERVARIAAEGAFLAAGQRCTATRRLVVESAIYDDLLEALVAFASKMKLGSGMEIDTTVPPLVSSRELENVSAAVHKATEEGADLLLGGKRAGGDLRYGAFWEPTILDNVKPSMEIAQKEVFGPVLSVIKVDSPEHAIEIANNTEYGLSAGIMTGSLEHAMKFAGQIDSGMIHINRSTAGSDLFLPFGGIKASGAGDRELGRSVLNFFTEERTVYVQY